MTTTTTNVHSIRANEITPDFVQSVKKTYKNKKVVVIPDQDYKKMLKAWRNAEYLAKLDASFKELEEGKVVVMTMEQLEEMAR
jgi:antitoxin YefM